MPHPTNPPEDTEPAISEAEALLPPTHSGTLERWLRTVVVAAYDELKADPSSAIPSRKSVLGLRRDGAPGSTLHPKPSLPRQTWQTWQT
jgi:hypothetical protein